jgi:sugar lactone lactonase YvrE
MVKANGPETGSSTPAGSSATFQVGAAGLAAPARLAPAPTLILAKPEIAYFTATPAKIKPGQPTVLAWKVANAKSVSINQGVGTVTGTSIKVGPMLTTTYTLTASNPLGSASLSVTVTVPIPVHNLNFLAGSLSGYGNLDGPGSLARFGSPYGVACDGLGDTFVADAENHTIRKIAPDGSVSTVAGASGIPGSADGTGSAARFHTPFGLVLDPGGTLYISDRSNHTIRKMTPAGVVSTVAGSPEQPGALDGNGPAARFNYPNGLALDVSGNLYVSDFLNKAIRRVSPTGQVTTFAGALGQGGFLDATGTAARFLEPMGLAMDGSGNLFVADARNHRIRKIAPTGAVSTFAGSASYGGSDGVGSAAQFVAPTGLAFDPAGNLYVSEGVQTIRKVTPAGEVSTLAGAWLTRGAADGQGSAATFSDPAGMSWDAAHNRMLLADSWNTAIRTFTAGGLVSTLAGSKPVIGSVDGMGAAARFWSPSGVAVDNAGTVYVADSLNHTIRKVTLDGTVTTWAGSPGVEGDANGAGSAARFRFPDGLALDAAGNLLVCEAMGNRIRKITPAGAVTTLAGSYPGGGSADGIGTAAQFSDPNGIAVDSAGNAFVTDRTNHTIRKITPAGVVTTVAGAAGLAGSADGVGSAARFNWPHGIAVDAAGNLFVAEWGNHTIRRIAPNGTVTTLAGSPGLLGSADGAGSAARFHGPGSLALDPVSGNLWVGDAGNSTLRLVTPAGVVSTLAGQAGKAGIQLGALPGMITGARGLARFPDGRLALTVADGLIVFAP